MLDDELPRPRRLRCDRTGRSATVEELPGWRRRRSAALMTAGVRVRAHGPGDRRGRGRVPSSSLIPTAPWSAARWSPPGISGGSSAWAAIGRCRGDRFPRPVHRAAPRRPGVCRPSSPAHGAARSPLGRERGNLGPWVTPARLRSRHGSRLGSSSTRRWPAWRQRSETFPHAPCSGPSDPDPAQDEAGGHRRPIACSSFCSPCATLAAHVGSRSPGRSSRGDYLPTARRGRPVPAGTTGRRSRCCRPRAGRELNA